MNPLEWLDNVYSEQIFWDLKKTSGDSEQHGLIAIFIEASVGQR